MAASLRSISDLVGLCLVEQSGNRKSFRKAELSKRSGELFAVGRLAVPAGLILHEADALALDGVGKNDGWLADGGFGLLENVDQLAHVVTAGAQDVPAEAGVLFGERLNLHHILDQAVDLQAVAVDDGDDVVETEVAGLHRRLPHLAFLLFAIAHQAEDLVPLTGRARCKRHAHRNAQPLPKRAGGDFNTR